MCASFSRKFFVPLNRTRFLTCIYCSLNFIAKVMRTFMGKWSAVKTIERRRRRKNSVSGWRCQMCFSISFAIANAGHAIDEIVVFVFDFHLPLISSSFRLSASWIESNILPERWYTQSHGWVLTAHVKTFTYESTSAKSTKRHKREKMKNANRKREKNTMWSSEFFISNCHGQLTFCLNAKWKKNKEI